MGLLDLIPVVIGAGIILKTREKFLGERTVPPSQMKLISIHERARRKAEEVL